MQTFLLILLSYLAGSIPFGFIFTYFSGLGDIRSVGSGNIGATNVLRTGNKKVAALTLLCDALKGFAPVFWVYTQDPSLAYMAGMASILGHIFPIWLRFKGGKGVATALGVYLALNPILTLITITIWLLVAKIGRISSLSALVAFCLAPFFALGLVYLEKAPSTLPYFSFGLALLILFTHRGNIQRLISGTEPSA